MENKRYKPRFDKLYLWITLPTAALMAALLIISLLFPSKTGWIVTAVTTLLVFYFLISPCFGYVELTEETVRIKFGFFIKRELPYKSIRGVEKKRTVISDSMLSLKGAREHVNIKFGKYDIYSVSVRDEDDFIRELKNRANLS